MPCTPSVAVNSEGDVGVTYYDLRTLSPGNTTTLPTTTWLTLSPRGGTRFGHEQPIAPSFDLLLAPNALGYFLGDYQALVANGESFRPFFVATNASSPVNPTDVFFEQVRSLDGAERAEAVAWPQSAGSTSAPALARSAARLAGRHRR